MVPEEPGVGGGPAPVNHPMLNPLTNALVYHEFFRHSDKVGLAVATGGMGTLANDAYGDAIGLRMEGLVMKLLHDHFAGALPVAVDGDSPQVPTKGTVAIDNSARPSGSPTYPLDVFAARSADRKKVAVSVVNPTEQPQPCELELAGVQATGPAKVYQLAAPAAAPPAPAGPGWGPFNGPPATVAESSLTEMPPEHHPASRQHDRVRVRGPVSPRRKIPAGNSRLLEVACPHPLADSPCSWPRSCARRPCFTRSSRPSRSRTGRSPSTSASTTSSPA